MNANSASCRKKRSHLNPTQSDTRYDVHHKRTSNDNAKADEIADQTNNGRVKVNKVNGNATPRRTEFNRHAMEPTASMIAEELGHQRQ